MIARGVIERLVDMHTSPKRQAVWSWDPKLPVAVRLRVGGQQGVLSRSALEDLVAQVDCGSQTGELRLGRVEMLAVPCFRSLRLCYVPGLPKQLILDLHGTADFLAETFSACPPCGDADCKSPACAECVALSVWAYGASQWCLTTGRAS